MQKLLNYTLKIYNLISSIRLGCGFHYTAEGIFQGIWIAMQISIRFGTIIVFKVQQK